MIKVNQPIFKRGSVTASNGVQHTYTDDELEDLCVGYDESKHKAPVQIGHVSSSSPAYGWIKSLEYDRIEGIVYAAVEYVDEVIDLIRRKLYQFSSATFYPPTVPEHPNSGKGYYLKALALLGAVPPAVKGLPALEYSEGDTNCLTCDLISENLPNNLEEIKNGVQDLQQRVAELEYEKEKTSVSHYLERLISKGNITPSVLPFDKLLNLLMFTKGLNSELAYSEGDSPYNQLTTLLDNLKMVQYSEIADMATPVISSSGDSGFSPHEKALNLVRNKKMGYREALRQSTETMINTK